VKAEYCPALSVVIPTLGRPSLRRTVESLAQQRSASRLEVLVVGVMADPSLARAVRDVAERGLNLRLLPLSFAGGDSSRKKNAGWQAAQAEIVAFLDDDVVAPPEWADRILEPFADSAVRIVSGPGWVPADATGFARLGGLALSSLAAGYVAERYVSEAGKPRVAPWSRIIGCNMAWRRSALEALGGFDPAFWPGEEMIAAWRTAGAAAGRLVVHPGAGVFHAPRETVGSFWRQVVGYGATRLRLIRAGTAVEWLTLLPAVAAPAGLALLALASRFRWAFGALAVGAAAYAVCALSAAVGVARRTGRAGDLAVAAAVPLMHLAYGWGLWRELLRPGRDFSPAAAGATKH